MDILASKISMKEQMIRECKSFVKFNTSLLWFAGGFFLLIYITYWISHAVENVF